MAARLKFGTATSNEGFTPLSTASFNDLRPARIVRELVQNSLDAAVAEAGEDTAIMRFQVAGISRRQIPDLKGYEDAFEKAVEHQARIGNGTLPVAAQQVVDHIRKGLSDVDSGKATLLSVTDNGIGLDIKRMNSLLGDGSSAKSDSASGSYGVGHLAPMSLSDIKYMLYGGVTENGSRLVAGQTVLASHSGCRRLNAAQGYLIDGFRDGLDGNLYDFIRLPYPRIVMNRLGQIASEWGHGSVVMMLVFNHFRSDLSLWEVVSKVAAYNFCAALYRDKLLIEVANGSETHQLDKTALERVLGQDKERTRATRSDSFFEGLRPSGGNAYSILRTLADRPRQRVKVNSGAAYLSLMSPSLAGNTTRVDLFRNGMWITDDVFALRRSDFANRQPFHAVIEVEAKDSGALHRLVRKAEGPMHDTLSFSLLSKTEEAELRVSLRQLADCIRDQLPEVGNEGYMVDDFLLVSADSDSGKGKRSFSFWGIPTVASRNQINALMPGTDPILVEPNDVPEPPDPPRPPAPPRPPRPKERRYSPLPFRSVIAPHGNGRLRASIASQRDLPEAWLILRIDENTDVTCDRIWRDEDVSIGSFRIRPADGEGKDLESEIISGGKVVKVCGFSENTTYELDIEYNTPQGLANVVGDPVFRLELYRPSIPPERREET